MSVFEGRGTKLIAPVVFAFWCVSCATSPADGDGGTGGDGGDCMTSEHLDISGGYAERYNCASEGICTEKDVTIYLDIRPDPDDTDLSDGKDYTFCETGGLGPLCIEIPEQPGTFLFSGRGTICGSRFTWNAESPGAFTEEGIWDFENEGDIFTKASMYTYVDGGGGGICTGSGKRGPDPAPPPPLPCEDPI